MIALCRVLTSASICESIEKELRELTCAQLISSRMHMFQWMEDG